MAYIARSPAYGAFEKQTLVADGSTTTFALNFTVGSSSSVLVSVAGVIQEPEVGYSLSGGGTNIVFSSAPSSSDTVFVVFLGLARDVDNIANTGTITNKTELTTVANDDLLLIYDNDAGELKKIQKSNLVTGLTYTKGTFTGDGSTVAFTINSGRAVDDVLVFVNGICLVPTDDYTISGTTLTFDTAPAASAEITVRYLPI